MQEMIEMKRYIHKMTLVIDSANLYKNAPNVFLLMRNSINSLKINMTEIMTEKRLKSVCHINLTTVEATC